MITKTVTTQSGVTIVDAKIKVGNASLRGDIVHTKYDIHADENLAAADFGYLKFEYQGGNVVEEAESAISIRIDADEEKRIRREASLS